MIRKTFCIVCLLSGGALLASEAREEASVSETVTVPTYEQRKKELENIRQQIDQYLANELSAGDAAKFSRLLNADIRAAGPGEAYATLVVAVALELERISTAEVERLRGVQAPAATRSVPSFSGTSRRVGSVVDHASSTITQLKAELAVTQQQLIAEREEKAKRLASSQAQLRALAAKMTELSSVNARMRVQMAHDAQARAELERLIAEQSATIEQQTKELQDADARLAELNTILEK